MQQAIPLETLDGTRIVVFKNLRDGCLILDKDDRVLFIKAKVLNMGNTQEGGTIVSRLIDPNYQQQYNTLQIAKPRAGWHITQAWLRVKQWGGLKVMPTHSPYGGEVINKFLQDHKFGRVVDFGSGDGHYGRVIKAFHPTTFIVGIEVFEPYVKQFDLNKHYDQIVVADMRVLDFTKYPAELAIFGDVLEHLTKGDALTVIGKARHAYKNIIINIPTGTYPQGAVGGNQFEAHQSTWELEELETLLGDFKTQHHEKKQSHIYTLCR